MNHFQGGLWLENNWIVIFSYNDKSFAKGACGEGEELFEGAAGCSSAQQVKTQITMINRSTVVI